MATDGVVLEARGISKTFPGVKALDKVSLTLRAGRLTALLGENGAGKSTLVNIIGGVFPPDEGEILLGGRAVRFADTRAAQGCGIAMIFQELNSIPNMTVAENIFLGREPLNRFGLIDHSAMHRQTAALLARLELDISPGTPVGQLRVGQQQMVEIAKALAFDVRILIMDEPTSAISEHEIELLFKLIADLKRQGVAIAYITHKLDELFRIGDDASIMRDGKLIGSAALENLTRGDIVRMMVGRDLSDMPKKIPAKTGKEVLRVDRLTLGHPHRKDDYLVENVSFHVGKGEVLGIFGLMGAGRTELLEMLFGLHAGAASGEVFVEGRRVKLRSPADAIDCGLALRPRTANATDWSFP